MSGFDGTFRAPIPGISLTHKLGSLPHEKPPQYTNPNDALEYFWKQFHRKEILKQIWSLLDQGCTVWAITKAILCKACLEGIIQLNLAMVIYQTVGQMILTLGKAKNINLKVNPKFRDGTFDSMKNNRINEKLGRKTNQAIPPSALKATILPKPDEITRHTEQITASKQPNQTIQDHYKPSDGLLAEIQKSKGQM